MAGDIHTSRLDERILPEPLRQASRWGTRVFVVAMALVALAFLTNPEPTADLLGVGLPVTLPVTQPKTGHSALSYQVGMWLWEFSFPFAILAAYRRWGHSPRRERFLLLGLPAVYMSTLTLYCGLVYVPNVTPTPLGPAATAVCWAFCATGVAIWGLLAALVAGLGLLAWFATSADWRGADQATLAFGVLSLPLGVPAVYLGYRRLQASSAT